MENREVGEWEEPAVNFSDDSYSTIDFDDDFIVDDDSSLIWAGISEKTQNVFKDHLTEKERIRETSKLFKLVKEYGNNFYVREAIKLNFPNKINNIEEYVKFKKGLTEFLKRMKRMDELERKKWATIEESPTEGTPDKLSSKAKEENTTQKNISNKLSNAIEETTTVEDLNKSKCCILI